VADSEFIVAAFFIVLATVNFQPNFEAIKLLVTIHVVTAHTSSPTSGSSP
jgi:hypothetical protein